MKKLLVFIAVAILFGGILGGCVIDYEPGRAENERVLPSEIASDFVNLLMQGDYAAAVLRLDPEIADVETLKEVWAGYVEAYGVPVSEVASMQVQDPHGLLPHTATFVVVYAHYGYDFETVFSVTIDTAADVILGFAYLGRALHGATGGMATAELLEAGLYAFLIDPEGAFANMVLRHAETVMERFIDGDFEWIWRRFDLSLYEFVPHYSDLEIARNQVLALIGEPVAALSASSEYIPEINAALSEIVMLHENPEFLAVTHIIVNYDGLILSFTTTFAPNPDFAPAATGVLPGN